MYKYGIVCFTGIMISSFVGRIVCSIHIFYLQDIILMHVQYNTLYHTCIYSCLPEDEPSGSKHIEDQKLKIIFNLEKLHVGLYYIIMVVTFISTVMDCRFWVYHIVMPSNVENCNMFLLRNLEVKAWFAIKFFELFREVWSNVSFWFILLFVYQIVGYQDNVSGMINRL
jgi:hypothetical protein